MEKDLENWESFITELAKEEKYKVKEKVIEGSEFLSFLGNKDEWESGPSSYDKIEKYYRKKWIQPSVMDPKLTYFLISGDEGYKFAKGWIKTEMLDKAWLQFSRESIDEFFIAEICEESSYKTENIIREKEQNEEVQNMQVFELLKKRIYSYAEGGNDTKELILLITSKFKISLLFSPKGSEYNNLVNMIGKVIVKSELKNNFQISLLNKRDLDFRWIFWGLKWEYNAANLYTYFFLHVWYNLEKGENFSSNAVAYLKNS